MCETHNESTMIHLLLFTTTLAQVSAQPVDVQSCVVKPATFLSENNLGARERVDQINVSFVNRGSAPLTSVTFRIHYNGETQTVVDRGSFAPGTNIEEHLGAFEFEPYSAASASCEVISST